MGIVVQLGFFACSSFIVKNHFLVFLSMVLFYGAVEAFSIQVFRSVNLRKVVITECTNTLPCIQMHNLTYT